MRTIENTNTKGLVKYQNLLRRMYNDFDVLPIGMVTPSKYLDGVKQQVVIELVKEHCYVNIYKTDDGYYCVSLDIEGYEKEYLDYNLEEYVRFKDLKHLLKQIDFHYFIKRITNEIIIGEYLSDILDDDLPF